MPTARLITDSSHYTTVLDLAMKAKRSLWIGIADIKDLYVLQVKTEKPFLGMLAELLGKGVEERFIHAKEQRTELPCRLRPISATGQVAGTSDVPEGTFQDHRHRPDLLLCGQRQPHGHGHGDEIAPLPQLRNRNPHR